MLQGVVRWRLEGRRRIVDGKGSVNEVSVGIKEENKTKQKKVRSSSIELSVLDFFRARARGGVGGGRSEGS
jgi:hypothetical protein